jgi:hypothetical protein
MDEDIKYVIAPIIGVLFFLLFLNGCVTDSNKTKHELLHYQDNYVMKNIDIKEIIKKDFC